MRMCLQFLAQYPIVPQLIIFQSDEGENVKTDGWIDVDGWTDGWTDDNDD